MDRFGSSIFLFISNLVLARLLSPDDFGAIAMLMVFISLSEAIVDAGFSSALIQKKDADQIDCSTIFVWNIIFGIALYGILFFSAPAIASFYNIGILKDVLRIQGLVIPMNSLMLVHIALLKKNLNFKRIAKINLFAIVVGTLVGIGFAFYGAGVWSLVIKLLLTAAIQLICYYSVRSWSPSIRFEFKRFKSLFSFGAFIFLNTVVNTLYHNVLALVVGKFFSSSTLGYYNQARKLEDVPRSALSAVVSNVAFSALSQISSDIPRLKEAARKCLRNLAFLSVPMMILAIVAAEPLILLLFTEKWAQSIPYFQILCIGALILTPLELNAEVLNALGKSKTSLYIRIFQRTLGILIIVLSISFGMIGLLIAYVVGHYLSFIAATHFTGRNIGYGLLEQAKDLFPFVITSIVAAAVALLPLLMDIHFGHLALLTIQTVLFFIIYIVLSVCFRFKELDVYKETVTKFLRKK